MKLKEYLIKEGITQSQLARELGITRAYVSHICMGLNNPSTKIAHEISAFTKGKVQVHEVRICSTTCMPGCACSKGVKK